ncbi:hypothetical protein RI129_000783 [Pyrocoelia pectoralis]|uniref:Ribosome biogenesis protein NOP53 n=1 Tax=Pyrocoelia pectoralis TaxID=417401 RepID=A0AAN7VU29_9COLE
MNAHKKKRQSKKSKLSWRKHVDISDVEHFFEDKWLQERLGKPASEKANDELFLVDTTPNAKKIVTSKQKRRLLLKERLPKCFSILQPHTAVPAPISKKNQLKGKSTFASIIEKKLLKHLKKGDTLPIYNRAKVRRLNKLKSKQRNVTFNSNVWNCEALNQVDGEWMNDDTKRHTLHGTSKYRKIAPHSVHSKPTLLPSIEVPHPGTSYNPNFEDHRMLLKEAAKREEKVIKEERHLDRVTTGMFSKVTVSERDDNWLVEMSQGLEDEDANNSDSEYKSINPPVKNKKKDLKQRRKHREHNKMLNAIRMIKKTKKKITDIHNLKNVMKDIQQKSNKTEMLKLKRLKKKEYTRNEPKRLARRKFEESEIEFNAPQDISGNLRTLKREGSVLMDRFKSFERRNILRPSSKHNLKKGKFKKFTKSDHKDDWKTTVARPNIS